MGSDAKIFIFDYNRYTQVVAPALRDLLLTGQAEAWLAQVMEQQSITFDRSVGADLQRHCTYLDHDLAWTGAHSIPDGWFASWDVRACASVTCPEHYRCPFQHTHQNSAEQLHEIFAAAIAHRCLGKSQFVGRTMTVARYEELLTRLGISSSHPLQHLFYRLGWRGWVLGYAGCGSAEGIHGWLNTEETYHLVQHLSALALPDYPPTFAAMEAFRPLKPGPYSHPSASFLELSLSFVRTVATLALQEGQGILWGNDLSTER